MHIPKNYFHDRLILLLLSSSAFLALLNAVLILLRLDSSRGSYIVQFRGNLGLSAYKAGDASTFISFVIFGLLVLAIQVVLSMRAFNIRRQYAVVICALSLLLIILTIVVSNALLTLR
jgi:hypothetical protein